MLIIPAVDIYEGKLVRLYQGKYGRKTVYSSSPVEVARKWEEEGAKRIHVIDLEGAKEGSPINSSTVLKIREKVSLPLQVGGGVRREEDVEFYLREGIEFVILGTRALEKDFLRRICKKFPGRIIVSMDIKGEEIRIKGWKEKGGEISSFLKSIEDLPLDSLIITDIQRDGTLGGVRIEIFQKVSQNTSLPLILSGGISSLEDLKVIRENFPSLKGVIIGKALYEGKIDLREATRWADTL